MAALVNKANASVNGSDRKDAAVPSEGSRDVFRTLAVRANELHVDGYVIHVAHPPVAGSSGKAEGQLFDMVMARDHGEPRPCVVATPDTPFQIVVRRKTKSSVPGEHFLHLYLDGNRVRNRPGASVFSTGGKSSVLDGDYDAATKTRRALQFAPLFDAAAQHKDQDPGAATLQGGLICLRIYASKPFDSPAGWMSRPDTWQDCRTSANKKMVETGGAAHGACAGRADGCL